VTRRVSRDNDDELGAEWRRLRRAAVFFLACAAIFAALLIVGLYH